MKYNFWYFIVSWYQKVSDSLQFEEFLYGPPNLIQYSCFAGRLLKNMPDFFSHWKFLSRKIFALIIFEARFFSDVKFFCPEIFARENFKARNFSGDKFFSGKKFCISERVHVGSLSIWGHFFSWASRKIFALKIFWAGFFWMRNYFVRKFLGHKDYAAGKMVGLMDCQLPFLIERLVQRTWFTAAHSLQHLFKNGPE